MPRIMDASVVREVQRKALANGGSVRPFADGSHSRTVEWDVAGRCHSPVTVELHGRAAAEPGERRVLVRGSDNRPNFVEMTVRCRKCSNCLRLRAYQWRMRAMSEWRASGRTWLATLTLSPTSWTLLQAKTRVRLSRGGTDWDTLPGPSQFLEIESEGYREVQRWFKRLRKETGVSIRYLAVTEAHKSGLPHWHVLLHEATHERLSYNRQLKGSWTYGFDSYKLVRDAAAAGYVCKYLGKDISARVRASLSYGDRGVAPTPLGGLRSPSVAKERRRERMPPEQGGCESEYKLNERERF